jgi:flagellar hook-length control protein FliK
MPSVGEQILDSLRASLDRRDNQIVVRLHPPELGTVLVRFREGGEQISGLLEVGRSETRYEIEQVLPAVLRNLHEAGIAIERLEVVVSGQPERDLARGQPQQDVWSQQQHGSNQPRDLARPASFPDDLNDAMCYPTGLEEEPRADRSSHVARGRINLLL